ncbi:MAG: XdhC family protein [Gemmatimonadota bacterium]|nr:XdhC family protein [Gemmatimonadota bacterium]
MKLWLETRQVLDRLGALHREGQRAALATVIRVRGSAYRHEGAKLLVPEEGDVTGNVSGGCLEEDVREVARRVIASGVAERRSYCGGANEIAAWDLGVGCEGEVEILIEPCNGDRADERALLAAEEAFVVLTRLDAVADRGPTERRVVKGKAAEAWLAASRSHLERDGDAETFVDVLRPPPRLLIVSAGDDARHLARVASDVGFRVVVADRRPGLLDPARFPRAARLVETDAARLNERLVLDEDSFAVVMTHHFADDTDYLRALLRTPARYLGVLGPRQRTERILGILRAEGPVDESRIFGPVGLDIGTDGAEQVALAVIAEILAVRSGRRPGSLRDRSAPIHATGE